MLGCLSLTVGLSTPSVATPPDPSEAPQSGNSLAHRRLAAIQDRAGELLSDLRATGSGAIDQAEVSQRASQLIRSYEQYLVEYPEDVPALILYGKFLRGIGEVERANMVFVAANELDPAIAVVKQQIGNYLAERGDAILALAYLEAAVELEPDVAVYQYQLGELLALHRETYRAEELLDDAALDDRMVRCFARASALDPGNLELQARHALALEELSTPRRLEALDLWQTLAQRAPDDFGRQWGQLNQARVLIDLNRHEEALAILGGIDRPALQPGRDALLSRISGK